MSRFVLAAGFAAAVFAGGHAQPPGDTAFPDLNRFHRLGAEVELLALP